MRRTLVIVAPVLLLLALYAACSPDFAQGIPCKNDLECPSQYECVDQKCAATSGSTTGGPGADGGGGSGGKIGFTVEPTTVSFGGVQVKDQKVLTVKVTNVAKANAPIQVKGTVKTGGDIFKSLTDSYVTVAPKSQTGMVDVQVAYTPTSIKSDTGVLVVSSDEPGNPFIEVSLNGNGTDPDLDVTPGSIDFGTQFRGAPVTNQKVTVKNAGKGTMQIQSIDINTNPSTQYSLVNLPAMPKDLDTNSSFTFEVKFTPSIPGSANGNILVKAADRDKPTASIALKATVQDQCPPGKYDVNEDSKDGCECKQEKAGGKNCVEAVDLGPIPDTAAVVTKTGNLVPKDDEDWYTFTAADDEAADVSVLCDKFHVRVLFTQAKNPDNLAIDFFQGCGADKRDSCASTCQDPNWVKTNRICEASQDKVAFAIDMSIPDPDPNKPGMFLGECPCTQKSDSAGTIGQNHCLDDTQRFYVRVYRVNTSAYSCQPYELEVSNGFYKYTDP